MGIQKFCNRFSCRLNSHSGFTSIRINGRRIAEFFSQEGHHSIQYSGIKRCSGCIIKIDTRLVHATNIKKPHQMARLKNFNETNISAFLRKLSNVLHQSKRHVISSRFKTTFCINPYNRLCIRSS